MIHVTSRRYDLTFFVLGGGTFVLFAAGVVFWLL